MSIEYQAQLAIQGDPIDPSKQPVKSEVVALFENVTLTRDNFADLAAITSSDVAIGDYARIVSIDAIYQRAPDAATDADLDYSGGAGVKWYIAKKEPGIFSSSYGSSNLVSLSASFLNTVLRLADAAPTYGPVNLSLSAGDGEFTASGTVSVKTWAPIVTTGRALIDASSSSGVLFSVEGSAPPASLPADVLEPAATTLGGVAGGAMVVTGPGLAVAGSVGAQVGYTTSGNDANENVRAKIDSLILQDFETGLNILNDDTYLVSANRLTVLRSSTAVVLGDGTSGTNSGERLSFTDSTFVGRSYGLDITSPGMNASFNDCSFDFCRLAAVRLTDAARYLQVNLSNCWLEESCDEAYVLSELGASNTSIPQVNLTNIRTVPTTTDSAESSALGRPLPTGGRSDGKSSQRTLFQGKMRLNINGIDVPYEKHNHLADDTLFMCDDDVQVIGMRGVNYPLWPQIPHKAAIGNPNWDGGDVADGTSYTSGLTPFFAGGVGALQPTHSSTQALGARTTSLRYTSGSSGAYINPMTLPVRVTGAQMLATAAIYAGGTTGALTSSTTIYFYDDNWKQSSQVASVSVDGAGFATFTTTADHGLLVNDVVSVLDTSGTLRKFRIGTVATSTTFVIATDTATVTLGSSVAYSHISPAPSRAVSSESTGGDVAAQYADTDFVGYTADRNWWLRPYQHHQQQIPQGVAWASARLVVSNLDSGDVLFLGGLALSQW